MVEKKVSRKELLKKPDEFITLSGKAIALVKKHSRKFEYLGIALAVLAILYLGLTAYLKHVNKKGQMAYDLAYQAIVKNMNPQTDKEALKKTEAMFKDVTEKYGLSKAARLAIPELAHIRFMEKDYDGAISNYEKFLTKLSDDDPYKALVRMALATCYEEKGELDKSIKTLEMISSGPDDFFKEHAMLSLARVYRMSKKPEKSDDILRKFVEKFKDSPLLPVAKAYLKS